MLFRSKKKTPRIRRLPIAPGTSVRALTMLGHLFPFLGLLLGSSCWIGCWPCMVLFGSAMSGWSDLIRGAWGARQRRLLAARRRSRNRVWRWMPDRPLVPQDETLTSERLLFYPKVITQVMRCRQITALSPSFGNCYTFWRYERSGAKQPLALG